MADMVNRPPHYTTDPSGVECITITRHRNFNIGNAIKYLWRAGLKGGGVSEVEDLEKAVWYIRDEIKRLTAEGPFLADAVDDYGRFSDAALKDHASTRIETGEPK